VLGHPPWHADTFTELCLKVAMDPLPPLPGVPRLPAGFEDVVRSCLAKEPGHRFPDISALAVALLPFAPPHAHLLVERIGRWAPQARSWDRSESRR
jgi:serine/threonine-protein kinase